MRIITLPNGKPCTVGTYVKAWRTILTLAPDCQLPGWGHFPTAAGDILRELRYGMHDRINRHVAGYGVGRKWDDQWQRDAAHTARRVNTRRLIVRETECPRWLRPRLAHRLMGRDDF